MQQIVDLYVDKGWSAAAVGRRLNISAPLVLRAIHEQGHPVRRPGRQASDEQPVTELINALYRDSFVRKVLRKDKILRRAPGQPIAQRFPKPIELSRTALRDLYLEAGLSSDHIEFVTGQPRLRIRRWLHQHGIALRPPSTLAPVLRRVWGLE
ncbi:MAG: hypothetical protein LC808_27010 [Actinobacteria bacterium]|nr:hypothetical protein [Actinomycetota bacterium]